MLEQQIKQLDEDIQEAVDDEEFEQAEQLQSTIDSYKQELAQLQSLKDRLKKQSEQPVNLFSGMAITKPANFFQGLGQSEPQDSNFTTHNKDESNTTQEAEVQEAFSVEPP